MKAPSEKHLEDWIVDNLHLLGDTWEAAEYGIDHHEAKSWVSDTEYVYPYLNRILKRQARFPSGVADLIAVDDISICAIELKQGAVDGEAISQSLRYVHTLRQIYDRVCEEEYKRSKDVCDFYDYRQSVMTDRPDLAVKGMVIGHSLKDQKLLRTASLTGVEIVLYDYNPTANHYTFEMLYHPTSDYDWNAYVEFADGAIGDGIRSIVAFRTAYRKERGWRNE